MTAHSILDWWALGYDVVPIIPPNARLTENSKIRPAQLGKIPGLQRFDGCWSGWNWRKHQTTETDVRQWASMSGGIGVRGNQGLVALDCDSLDPVLSDLVYALAIQMFGKAPCRVGRPPKFLLMYQSRQPIYKQVLRLGSPRGEAFRIEFLGDGQQWVVDGIHPGTGQPYFWDTDPVPTVHAVTLPVIDIDLIDGFFRELQRPGRVLDVLGYTVLGQHSANPGARENINQEKLKAPSLDLARQVISAIPNVYPDRETYIRVGLAIKAALVDYPEDAEELWLDWCAEWEGGHNDLDIVLKDWESFYPPYELGFEYLKSLARENGDAFAELDFTTAPIEQQVGLAEMPADRPAEWSEMAMAEKFVAGYAGWVAHVSEWKRWLLWTGQRWTVDKGKAVEHQVWRTLGQEAGRALRLIEKPNEAMKEAQRLSRAYTVKAVRDLATYHPLIASVPDQWDQDPWLLGTPNGVVDLRWGVLRPMDATDHIRFSTGCVPDWSCPTPRWTRFIHELVRGDWELAAFIQRAAGMAAAGVIKEHVLLLGYGPGGNGKGTLLRTLQHALGDYAMTASMDLLLDKGRKGERQSNDVHDLFGSRLVGAQETREGVQWDEQRLKSLTGGDRVRARALYANNDEADPTWTIWVMTNDKPKFRKIDDAITRRIRLLPMLAKPVLEDVDLPKKLEAELPGILAWIIEGCVAWQRHGLGIAEVVAQETNEYLADQDTFGSWMADRVVIEPGGHKAPSSSIYGDYCRWMGENAAGEPLLSQKEVIKRLLNRGAERGPAEVHGGQRGRMIKGIRVLTEFEKSV